MIPAEQFSRWSTAGAVLGVAAVAAVAYEHAYELVCAHGETGWTARVVQLTIDGLIYACSMATLVRFGSEQQVSLTPRIAALPIRAVR